MIPLNQIHPSHKGTLFRVSPESYFGSHTIEAVQTQGRIRSWIPVGVNGNVCRYPSYEVAAKQVQILNAWAITVHM